MQTKLHLRGWRFVSENAWGHSHPATQGAGAALVNNAPRNTLSVRYRLWEAAHPLLRTPGLEGQPQLLALGGIVGVPVQALPELVPGAPAGLPLLHRWRRRHRRRPPQRQQRLSRHCPGRLRDLSAPRRFRSGARRRPAAPSQSTGVRGCVGGRRRAPRRVQAPAPPGLSRRRSGSRKRYRAAEEPRRRSPGAPVGLAGGSPWERSCPVLTAGLSRPRSSPDPPVRGGCPQRPPGVLLPAAASQPEEGENSRGFRTQRSSVRRHLAPPLGGGLWWPAVPLGQAGDTDEKKSRFTAGEGKRTRSSGAKTPPEAWGAAARALASPA